MIRRALLGCGLLAAGCSAGSDTRPDSVPQAPAIIPAPETSSTAPSPPRAASTVTKTTVPPVGPARTAQPAASSPQPAARNPQPAAPDQRADQGVVVAPTLATVDTTITIRANGPELLFDPATITLKQGTRVRLRFVNMGSFAHNFILVRNEDDLDEIIQRAHDATENVPLSMKAKMITYSNIAQPTRTVETAFVVPPPGDYTYVCLVEGHANTMIGRLRSTP